MPGRAEELLPVDSAAVQVHGEVAGHVGRARVDVAGRRQAWVVTRVGLDGEAEEGAMGGGESVRSGDVLVGVGVRHHQGVQDPFLDVGLPGGAGDRFDDGAEDNRVQVGVLEALADRAVQLHVGHASDDVGDRVVGVGGHNRAQPVVARDPTGLVEEVPDRQLRRGSFVSEPEGGQVVPYRCVEIELARFGELHDGERSDRFGVGADPERCVGGDLVAVAVGAEALGMNDDTVFDDGERRAGYPGAAHLVADVLIDSFEAVSGQRRRVVRCDIPHEPGRADHCDGEEHPDHRWETVDRTQYSASRAPVRFGAVVRLCARWRLHRRLLSREWPGRGLAPRSIMIRPAGGRQRTTSPGSVGRGRLVGLRRSSVGCSHDPTGVPSRCSAARRRMESIQVDAAAREDPRDDRVRVPHVPGGCLVATPHRCGDVGQQLQHPRRDHDVSGQVNGAVDGRGDVGDDAVAPAAHLVAEEAQATGGAEPDGSDRNHAAGFAVVVRDWGLFDGEAALRHDHLESGVVEIAAGSSMPPG